MNWADVTPDTRLSELTAGDLVDLVGWALANYRAGEQDDVHGFMFAGARPVFDYSGPSNSLLTNSSWSTFQGQFWAAASAGRGRKIT